MEFMEFTNGSFWLKIVLCVLCGLVVGVERQWHRKPIDIRTAVLICLGTMTFIYLSTGLDGEKDSTRVLGQVVTGIGFLGAGAIFHHEGLVVGMTSASVIWVLAAIGAAIGLEKYAVAIVISVLTVILQMSLHSLENFVMQPTNGDGKGKQ